MNRSKSIFILTVSVVVLYLIVSPYIVVRQMTKAADSHDLATLASRIDFVAVSSSLRTMVFKKKVADEGVIGAMDEVLGEMMEGEDAKAGFPAEDITRLVMGILSHSNGARTSMSYSSLSKFTISFSNNEVGVGTLTLQRSGLGWRLTEIFI